MQASTIQWHLARDDQIKLARFCEKHRVRQDVVDRYEVDGKGYFTICFQFDNDGYITAELRAGDTRSYSVADHFQVTDYKLGADPCDECGLVHDAENERMSIREEVA